MKTTQRLIAGLAVTLLCSSAAWAEKFPNRPITYIISSGAGSGPDQMIRGIAPKLSEKLGVPVVIDNRPGAGGLIAMNAIGAAAPDGYTIGHGNIQTLAISPNIAQMSLDALNHIDYIGLIGTAPNIFVIGPSISGQINSIPSLVAFAKKYPGKLTYASGGNGTSHHLGMELFKQMAGVDIVHAPYKSTTAGITDLAGGRIDMAMDTISGPSARMDTSSNGVRHLAMTGLERNAKFPNLPTMAEEGIPNFEVIAWAGIVAPKGLSAEKREVLNRALDETLQDPAVKDFLVSIGYTPSPKTAAAFQEFAQNERTKWGSVIKNIGMKAD